MPRLSIEVSETEHQQLKAIAASKQQSLRDLLVSQTLAQSQIHKVEDETAALTALYEHLRPSIEEATSGGSTAFDFDQFLEKKRSQSKM